MDAKKICSKKQVERYLLNQMDLEEESSFQEHLAQCDSCRSYLERIRVVAAIVGDNNFQNNSFPEIKKKTFQLWHWLSVASCILLMVGGATLGYKWYQKTDEVLYPTSIEYRNRALADSLSVKLLYPDQDTIYIKSSQSVLFKWNYSCSYHLNAQYENIILFDIEGEGSEFSLFTDTLTSYPYIIWNLKVDEQSYSGQITFFNN
nr:zf-HC2 domain-containing protein [Parabacteroides goldsteinii]